MSIGAIRAQGETELLSGPGRLLSRAALSTLDTWLAMIAEDDFSDLPSIIAADAVFHSPVGLKPYLGRDLVCLMVRTAAGVFEDFRYHRKLVDSENAALEFSAHIGDIELKAIHLIRFNAAGEIMDIEKIVRPSAAWIALGDAMGALIGPQIKALRAAGGPG